MEEIEVKFLNIDAEEISAKLESIGAKKIFHRLYKRKVFDYPDLRLDKKGAWIRLRNEGDKITLAFKQRIGVKAHDGSVDDKSMEEIEIKVSDFEKTGEFLKSVGLKEKTYQENKRIRYIFEKIEFDIDFWPHLEPYLEIEADSWEEIDKAIKLLGLNPEEKRIFSTHQVYKLKGIDEEEYKEMTFDRMVKKKSKI